MPQINKNNQNKNCNPDVRKPYLRFASNNTADNALSEEIYFIKTVAQHNKR